ncbi:MAG: hypothetical protein R3B70_46580, partial [Polyangiaceae bacterium]
MAPRLGGAFATGALGPVHYAGQLILAKRAEEGLRELSVENLRGGVARGILQASQLVGVGTSDIERLLPMHELAAMYARIATSHPRTLEAWRMYAGGLGGLLSGVADLTVDGRAPDTALCVARLAKKVQRDKPFAEPLQKLADDLFDYQDLLHRCVDLLNDTTALQKAYARRRLRKLALIAAGATGTLMIVVAVIWFFVARARVNAVIDNPDPCASMALGESDLERASDEMRAKALGNRTKCEADRAAEAKRAEAEKLRIEREAAEKKARDEQEAKCAALATHLAEGKLTPEDEAFAKDSAPLLTRLANGELDLPDLGPTDPPLPCKGTSSEKPITAAFRKAVLAKPWSLPKVEVLSPAAIAAI